MKHHRRILIAGTGSGAGKTTVTIAVMAALKRKGLKVQGFKCGPDYIDPTYHTTVTGRASRNLDSWMFPPETLKEIFVRGSRGADISVIEGVMGLFDGKRPDTNTGSTAEIGMITGTPVLLVVDCRSMARSAAAVVKGFQLFSPDIRIAGVICNKVGSEGHYRLVKTAVEQECGVPVVGYLERDEGICIPERHLGLVPSLERGEWDGLFDRLAERAAETVDLDLLLKISESPPLSAPDVLFANREPGRRVRIAIARDAAFHFYYPENLELLEAYGADLIPFSPLAGETVPDGTEGLYIGGGFPEEFAGRLSAMEASRQSVRSAIESGVPTLAECGGFMYLTDELETTDGKRYPMAGCLPGRVRMQTKRAALGYREVSGMSGNFLLGPDEKARGHEFHYSVFEPAEKLPAAYETTGRGGTKPEGCQRYRLVAGYTHLHFASNPGIVRRWIEACRKKEAL